MASVVKPVTNEHELKLRRLRKLARKVCAARQAEQQAKREVDELRPDMVALMQQLGLSIVQAFPGESVQLVERVTRKHDEEAIAKYIQRYQPELYDHLFPPVRQLHKERLRDAIDSGLVRKTVEKHIHDKHETPQLRRVVR